MDKLASYSCGVIYRDVAKICPQNFARSLVLENFINEFNKIEDLPLELKVGVLGGGSDEPEVQALLAMKRKVSVWTIGLDTPDIHLNLNYLFHDNIVENFDLILCSQVIENVWNHNNFFFNLNTLVKHGGLVWLAAPATNHPHGSPDFYSPGFTHSYLKQNLENNKFFVISSGSVGSRRLYYATTFLAR